MEQKLTLYVDALPVGAVILWYGDAQQIPDGWALCDGRGSFPDPAAQVTRQIPDLRGQFVRGCTPDQQPGAPGGTKEVRLSTAQLPAHHHTLQMRAQGDVPYHIEQSQLMSAVAKNLNINVSGGAVNMYDRGGAQGNAIRLQEAVDSYLQHGVEITDTGSGQPIPLVPAYVAMHYIIKVR